MTKMKLIASVLCIVVSVWIQGSDATLCKPLSSFKVDCNWCVCGSSGAEYACTEKICPSINYRQKFDIEEDDQGHVILTPKKPSNRMILDVDDNDFTFPKHISRKARGNDLPDPYLDDDLSKEKGEFSEVVDNTIDEETDESDEDKNAFEEDLGKPLRDHIGTVFNGWNYLDDPGRNVGKAQEEPTRDYFKEYEDSNNLAGNVID